MSSPLHHLYISRLPFSSLVNVLGFVILVLPHFVGRCECALLITNSSVHSFTTNVGDKFFLSVDDVERYQVRDIRCSSLDGTFCSFFPKDFQMTKNSTVVRVGHPLSVAATGVDVASVYMHEGQVTRLTDEDTQAENILSLAVQEALVRIAPEEITLHSEDVKTDWSLYLEGYHGQTGRLHFSSLPPSMTRVPVTFSDGLPQRRVATWQSCWQLMTSRRAFGGGVGTAEGHSNLNFGFGFGGNVGVAPCGEKGSVVFSGPVVFYRLFMAPPPGPIGMGRVRIRGLLEGLLQWETEIVLPSAFRRLEGGKGALSSWFDVFKLSPPAPTQLMRVDEVEISLVGRGGYNPSPSNPSPFPVLIGALDVSALGHPHLSTNHDLYSGAPRSLVASHVAAIEDSVGVSDELSDEEIDLLGAEGGDGVSIEHVHDESFDGIHTAASIRLGRLERGRVRTSEDRAREGGLERMDLALPFTLGVVVRPEAKDPSVIPQSEKERGGVADRLSLTLVFMPMEAPVLTVNDMVIYGHGPIHTKGKVPEEFKGFDFHWRLRNPASSSTRADLNFARQVIANENLIDQFLGGQMEAAMQAAVHAAAEITKGMMGQAPGVIPLTPLFDGAMVPPPQTSMVFKTVIDPTAPPDQFLDLLKQEISAIGAQGGVKPGDGNGLKVEFRIDDLVGGDFPSGGQFPSDDELEAALSEVLLGGEGAFSSLKIIRNDKLEGGGTTGAAETEPEGNLKGAGGGGPGTPGSQAGFPGSGSGVVSGGSGGEPLKDFAGVLKHLTEALSALEGLEGGGLHGGHGSASFAMDMKQCQSYGMARANLKNFLANLGEGRGDAGALEALWVLWVSPLPLAARKLMGALDSGLSGASRLCACICMEPDSVPAGVSFR
uniref:Uncharacterized protein n=1 Tax=Chromera velia CCMP2878 TaxID=1169474 RepID=A0A0G4HPS3_9ALVE|eukprot:Cvel_7829.t1-p1 / transcript=Cvel_7829.t1 / gene=Cvel_7829 / organism=Chromera_velia_CCMP2878 / gene_product=hypothetical protein / transcript_product=hypothetical protein / location=Cvel_scaffold418:51042-62190(-) / protein_length=883 / sequence_SO=supercontig / SO=protein_coding / is_pseudo=false